MVVSSILSLGIITSFSSPIYDCQAKAASASAHAIGFMVEETLVWSKLSTGQHILHNCAKENHTARSVTPKLALSPTTNECGYHLFARYEEVGAGYAQRNRPDNYK